MTGRWIRGAVLAGLVVVLVLYGRGRGDEATVEVQIEATVPGPCEARSFVIEPGTGSAKTVHLDRGEADGRACVFRATVEVPDADRYRVTVPGTDLPARTVVRSVMDERGPDGAVRLVLRVSW